MSSRVGTLPQTVFTFAAGNVGGSAGRSILLGNPSVTLVDAISIQYTPTGTAGNRAVYFQLRDSGGNILWQAATSAAIVATNVVRLVAGAGVTPVSTASPLMQTMQLPSELAVPPGSILFVADAANVDAADSISGNVSLAY